MASTSDAGSLNRPMRIAATTLSSSNHTLISDFRKTIGMMREIAVEFEKQNDTQKIHNLEVGLLSADVDCTPSCDLQNTAGRIVKELENAVLELLSGYEDCTHLSNVVQSLGDNYQPAPEGQFTDFKKLIGDELAALKARSQLDVQKSQLLRQFREAVWNVHHSGQPMPGEEQEDIVMTSTQEVLLNTKCPITGKPVTELAEPVRSLDCKHVYEKQAIVHHIATSRGQNCKCPVAGCRGSLKKERVICDAELLADIEDHRSRMKQNVTTEVIEDITED